MDNLVININRKCSVTLTDFGLDIINNYMEEYPYVKEFILNYRLNGNVYTDELWSLMEIFGKHLKHGGDIPFENNIITFE